MFYNRCIFFWFCYFRLLWLFNSFLRFRGAWFRWSWSCWWGRSRTSLTISIKLIKVRSYTDSISFFSEVLLYDSWNWSCNIDSHFICFNSSNYFIGIYKISWMLYKLFNNSFRYRVSHSWNFNYLLWKLPINYIYICFLADFITSDRNFLKLFYLDWSKIHLRELKIKKIKKN